MDPTKKVSGLKMVKLLRMTPLAFSITDDLVPLFGLSAHSSQKLKKFVVMPFQKALPFGLDKTDMNTRSTMRRSDIYR